MDAKELFIEALMSATKAVMMVGTEDFNKSTPDSEWDLKSLTGHMLYELSWTPDIVNGATIAEVGNKYDGDLIGSDLGSSWLRAEERAVEAVRKSDLSSVAHLSWMDATVEFYLKQAASDQLIHSWDLSAALSRPVRFNERLAEQIFKDSYSQKDKMEASGLFAPAIDVPESSDIQTKLLALYGRDINWRP